MNKKITITAYFSNGGLADRQQFIGLSLDKAMSEFTGHLTERYHTITVNNMHFNISVELIYSEDEKRQSILYLQEIIIEKIKKGEISLDEVRRFAGIR